VESLINGTPIQALARCVNTILGYSLAPPGSSVDPAAIPAAGFDVVAAASGIELVGE
jgi:hypothetical protein